MFEMRLMQGTLFKNLLEALSDLFVKACFDFSRTGLELQALDTSGIALVALILPADHFPQYSCDRDLSVGLSLADLTKVFRFANNDDIITIKADSDSFGSVSFTFESRDGVEISYLNLDCVGVNSVPFEIPEIPESEYQAILRMRSANFMRICNKLSSFGDPVVLISVREEGVNFHTEGKKGAAIILPEQPTVIIAMEEEVSLTFDLRRINSFSKLSTLSDQVTIRLSSEQPAVFEYNIPEKGYIRYYILPRKRVGMQNEGDEMQMTTKEDEMQNEGDEMQNEGDEMHN